MPTVIQCRGSVLSTLFKEFESKIALLEHFVHFKLDNYNAGERVNSEDSC